MKHYFGPDGLLIAKVPGCEYREPQLQMAQAVFDHLSAERPLVIEAATGIGKTWAYLIPALVSGKRVAVSTGTKTLQDQINDHDIPLLKRLFFPQLRAQVMKGRKNYLCRRRWGQFVYQPSFALREEARWFGRLQKWAERTRTGDRAEISWLPDHFPTWNDLSASSDQCLGQQCHEYAQCFLTLLKQKAASAQLVLVNHHLFFADLAVRQRGFGGVIPRYQAVVFDEAHQLEDIAAPYFGMQCSNFKIRELLHDVHSELVRSTPRKTVPRAIEQCSQLLENLSRQLVFTLRQAGGKQSRIRLDAPQVGKAFTPVCSAIGEALGHLATLLHAHLQESPGIAGCERRAVELAQGLRQLLEPADDSLIYWCETTQRGVFLHGTPIEVAPIFQSHLFQQTRAVVFTSATLAAAGTAAFVMERFGLPPDTRELLLPSPFAYERQALLYIPQPFPPPNAQDFCRQLAASALEILTRTRGRGLFLFTSYRNMTQVFDELRDQLPYPILLQGQKPQRVLLAEFKKNIESVLLATSSFWEGIDVPGEALTCLMIDKLPFEVPDDPLHAARQEALARRGRHPFHDYQVPRAVLHLRQGIGRLIRSSQDRGIIVLFDTRLMERDYGKVFLKSLPPCRLVHRLEEAEEYLKGLGI